MPIMTTYTQSRYPSEMKEKYRHSQTGQKKKKGGNPSTLYQLYRLMEVPYSDMKDSENQESVKATRGCTEENQM